MAKESIEDLYISVGVDVSKALKDTKQGVNRIEKEFGKVEQKGKQAFQNAGKSAQRFSGIMGKLQTMVVGLGTALLASFSFRKVKDFFVNSTKLAKVQIAAEEQLATVLESTGHAAGLSAEQLKNLASEMQNLTNYGDESVIAAENLLLTFTQIGQDVFPRALKSILDVSTAMKQDLKSSTVQIGKALTIPLKVWPP